MSPSRYKLRFLFYKGGKRVVRRLLVVLFLASFAFCAQAQTGVVQSLQNITNKAETYSAVTSFTLAATPTDVYVLRGSDTKTVYIKDFKVSCVKTNGGYTLTGLIKRTNLNTGGTSFATTLHTFDSTNTSATATAYHYSANPTNFGSGVSVALVYMGMPNTVASNGTSGNVEVSYDWGKRQDQYQVLRGTAQTLALNMGGNTLTGAVCAVNVVWMER